MHGTKLESLSYCEWENYVSGNGLICDFRTSCQTRAAHEHRCVWFGLDTFRCIIIEIYMQEEKMCKE